MGKGENLGETSSLANAMTSAKVKEAHGGCIPPAEKLGTQHHTGATVICSQPKNNTSPVMSFHAGSQASCSMIDRGLLK